MLQGTDEWRQARCGSIGSSDAPKVVRKTKTGYSADRANLLASKVLERLTDIPVEIPKTFAMAQGTAREPLARLTYALVKGVEVAEIDIVLHPRIKGAHASPDGLIGADGLVELKCPQPPAHLDTILNQTIGNDYLVQIQWQLACTGRAWCDYVSYNPDFPTGMHFWVRRIQRDAAMIRELEGEISKFIKEIDRKVEELSRCYAA
jgi:predicted phage-related endonuclease